MVTAAAGMFAVVEVAGDRHNDLVLMVALIIESDVWPCEAADAQPHTVRFGSCCCKNRLRRYNQIAEGMETLGSRSNRDYLGYMLGVYFLETAS